MSVDRLINEIIRKEGGYVNNPDDRGGPTNYGITLAEFRRQRGPQRTVQDLIEMPRHMAYDIYLNTYYKAPGFEAVGRLSPIIAAELTDTGVNMGPGVACRFFQRLLNVFNAKGTMYPDIAVDGQIGPASLRAFDEYLRHRGRPGEMIFLKALNCLQGARYIEISEAREANETFVYGWMANRI